MILIQSCSLAFDTVTEDNVYTCVGHPLRSDIENIVNWMLNDNFTDAYNSILVKNLILTELNPGADCDTKCKPSK